MTFDEVLDQVRTLLQQRGRVTYRSLKLRYQLDDEVLAGVTDELISAERVAVDEDGKVLVWTGGAAKEETENRGNGEAEKSKTTVASSQWSVASSAQPPAPQTLDSEPRTPNLSSSTPDARRETAERRQLTVMFCDLVGSTSLSEQLDPEELREVVEAYQAACEGVIVRLNGYVARYMGDGLLVYFGYPIAHEDAAARAVRAGLAIVGELPQLNARLRERVSVLQHRPLQVRIGIHSGLVVVGEMGAGAAREQVALGETPNIAARLQGIAEPDRVVISQATYRLVQGLFECHDLGPQTLKGVTVPLTAYRVLRESDIQSRFEAAVKTGLTPLVGRDHEVGLLRDRWERAKQGEGQVVLLSGEPGIGKSRLVQELKEQLAREGATRIEFRCLPYHQNSAFYPIIDHLQRLLQFTREDSPTIKLEKLQQTLAPYRFPQADTLPLLAALLSLPHPQGCAPLTFSPQRQKQKTQEAVVAWLREEAERNAVYTAWEDLHWADPSTLEVFTLYLDHVPTARLLALLTCRPEFISPWANRSYINQMTLSRLGRSQVEAMVEQVTGGKTLPPEVVEQIVVKTDGVPLFVEELTKTVIESIESIGSIGSVGSIESIGSVESIGSEGRLGWSAIPLGIPATLHDALMARLDRLGPAKEIAQLGASIGREFSYELLHAVSLLNEERLQQGLRQLVEAELLYQRGLTPQATYLFKHALIQDTAYQSLLKSRRQQLHQQIAQVLEERFPEVKETQPELVAHHYTEAGLIEQAIPYWQQAGQRAVQRSANIEAVSHLTRGLELLKTLPDTPMRTQQELTLQITLSAPLIASKGYGPPELERACTRALELCRQVGETPQLFPALLGLIAYYLVRAEIHTVRELVERYFSLAQRLGDPAHLVWSHYLLGLTLFYLSELAQAQQHLEQSFALYDPRRDSPLISGAVQDPKVSGLGYMAWVLGMRGYPDQALQRIQEALTLAQELAHPLSLAFVQGMAACHYQFRQEWQAAQEQVGATMTLCTEQGFVHLLAEGNIWRGWALAAQGQGEAGITQLRQGLITYRAIGAELDWPHYLALLAEAQGKAGRAEEGLEAVSEALTHVDKTGVHVHEAELYRLKGQLTLEARGWRLETGNQRLETRDWRPDPALQASSLKPPVSRAVAQEAEECFLKAIEIARKQQAKSLELRATMSLARLWRQQGRKAEARDLLAPVYNWFTEGFDTKDLQEAKALLNELT